MQRQFSSGSRQAPDPFDQYLEENNFYRKHTARDASCLFRVISEQMYDTQLHHLAIRKKCVRYMRKHRDFFQPLVERDLDEYLDDMSKPKTYGTLVELQAVGYMFQRNVLLFEPFNLGNFYSSRSVFNDVFRVFYTPERHFDSVFTCDYIKDAAICQSICYEILYKDLYKLPDVSFAVEHMLHSPSLDATDCSSEYNDDGYCTRIHLADGRTFDFDLPQHTNCILENYKLCHFHYTNFPRLSDDLHREMKIYNNRDDYEKNALCKTAESLLPNKYVSCVRQLLQEGITPFPYKVAKALDPNMYRNIEFDAWNEQRKELKLQSWYNGDSNFKVGAKCNVKLCKSENDLYTCHIQEIAVDKGYCIVFIEQLGEKRLVPYDSLTPLPPDQFKPWTLPYRFQRHMQKYSSVRFTRHYNYRFKLNSQFAMSPAHDYCTPLGTNMKAHDYVGVDVGEKDGKEHYAAAAVAAAAAHHHNGCYYKLKQYTHFENFRAHTVEYCTMPLTVEHALDGKPGHVNGSGNCGSANEHRSRSPSRSAAVGGGGGGGSSNCAMEQRNGKADMEADSNLNNPSSEELGNFDDMEQPCMGGAFLVPDLHCFYPMHQYPGIPEDSYGYSYEGGMPPPPTAFVPAGNGGFYYMYNPAAPAYPSAGNNLYMQAPPPLHPPHAMLTATPPHAVQGGAYYANPCCTNIGVASATTGGVTAAPGGVQNNPVAYSNTPTAPARGYVLQTPLAAINWEAKKSLDANGADLPNDMMTLRHFYNLGLECHRKHLKCNSDAPTPNTKEKAYVSKLNADGLNKKFEGNANSNESKSDGNNNVSNVNHQSHSSNSNGSAHSAPNSTTSTQSHHSYSGNNKPNYANRRFPSRYFNNNRDRQSYQRNQGGGGGGNSLAIVAVQNRMHNDYNNCNGNNRNRHMYGTKDGNAHTTPNSPRHHGMQNMNAAAGSGGGNANNMGSSVTDQAMQPSPMRSYESGGASSVPMSNGGTETAQLTPLPTYNPSQNPLFAYGSYEYAADLNAPSTMPLAQGSSAATANAAAVAAATAATGGVYIQMPFAASPYGIYAAPPPPTPHQAVGMHHAAPTGGPFPAPPPPPSAYMGLPPPAVAANVAMHSTPLPAMTNGFYATPTGISADVAEHGMNGESVQLPCISYPPPQFYYAANAAGPYGGAPPPPPANSSASSQATAGGGDAASGDGSGGSTGGGASSHGPQAYWCQTPKAVPQIHSASATVTPQININQNTTGVMSINAHPGTVANNRQREHKQPQSMNNAD